MTGGMLCLNCGRGCSERGEFVYLRPARGGGQAQPMGLCCKRCRVAYNGEAPSERRAHDGGADGE